MLESHATVGLLRPRENGILKRFSTPYIKPFRCHCTVRFQQLSTTSLGLGNHDLMLPLLHIARALAVRLVPLVRADVRGEVEVLV